MSAKWRTVAKTAGKRRAAGETSSKESESVVTSIKQDGTLRVYTDGACSGNGQRGATAGWGVHFPDEEFIDIYGPLKGTLQTNQRAELTAIVETLNLLHSLAFPSPPCVIYTDSSYSINCVTTWIKSWKKNGWMNAKRQPVLNSDLIKRIDALLQSPTLKGKVRFVHVRGHANDRHNDRADELARLGAAGESQLSVVDKRPIFD